MPEAVIGFGGALLGAVAGFLGAVYMERRRTQRTWLGMMRAVAAEMRENAASVVMAQYSGQQQDFSFEAWHAARFELAQFLDKKLFDDILMVYMLLPNVVTVSATVGQSEPVQTWLDKSNKTRIALEQQLPRGMRLGPEPDVIPTSKETTARREGNSA